MAHEHRLPARPPRNVVERGRSRDIPPAAIARRASEERKSIKLARQTAAAAVHSRQSAPVNPFRSQPLSTPSHQPTPPPSTTAKPHQTSPSAPTSFDSALSSSPTSGSAHPSIVISSPSTSSMGESSRSSQLRRHEQTSCMVDSLTRGVPPPVVSNIALSRSLFLDDEVDDTPLPPRSLQDQMQEAYAAENMLLARILYLKIQGIEVTSDDDPRIAQVKDEDFVFVPGGQLVLDDESMAALREAERIQKARRARDVVNSRARVLREKELAWEAEAQRVRSEKQKAQRTREAASASAVQMHHQLERTKGRSQPRGRQYPVVAKPLARTFSPNSPHYFRQSLVPSSSLPSRPSPLSGTPLTSVSFKEVVTSLSGRLFQDDDSSDTVRARSKMESDLLAILLQTVDDYDNVSSRRSKEKQSAHRKSWSGNNSELSSTASPSQLACSPDESFSGISRTNSWASSTSGVSVSTAVTTPSNSPSFDKPPLPPLPSLLDDKEFLQVVRRPLKRRQAKNTRVTLTLADTPLATNESRRSQNVLADQSKTSTSHQQLRSSNLLLTRVKRSVSSLLDLATKVQLSYVRTIQFAVPLASHVSDPPVSASGPTTVSPKPEGYRVCTSDVQAFIPCGERVTTRDLNLASDHNIPLLESSSDNHLPRPACLFPFVPPSPFRPRYIPLTPEWRLRPVSNPVTLRLRALQNVMYKRGVPWEGRAHSGSLGCGRERLTGVAFEGLGGSRLAFETT